MVRDEALFAALRAKYPSGAIAEVGVVANEVVVRTARPGILIGKQGKVAEEIIAWLRSERGPETMLRIEEIRRAELNAVLVADAVVLKLSRDVPLPRSVDMQAEMALRAGALGCRIVVSGGVTHEFTAGSLESGDIATFTSSAQWQPPYTVDDDGNEVPPPPQLGPPRVFVATVTIATPVS